MNAGNLDELITVQEFSTTPINLLRNSILEGGGSVPTFWTQPTATGTSTQATSSLGGLSKAYSQSGTNQRPYLQTTNALSVNANTNYVLSMQLESITGTINYNNVITITSIPSGASLAYYRNGVLISNPNTQALTGRLSVVLTVLNASGNVLPRIGLGVSGNATGTIVFSQPQFEQASSATTYQPTPAYPTGEAVKTWTERVQLWAQVKASESGGDVNAGMQMQFKQRYTFKTRYDSSVIPEDRILWEGKTYKILNIAEIDRRMYMIILAELTQ